LDFYTVSSLKQQSLGKHIAPIGHIIIIPNYHLSTRTHYCCVFR